MCLVKKILFKLRLYIYIDGFNLNIVDLTTDITSWNK
jgi:hypothetical protein